MRSKLAFGIEMCEVQYSMEDDKPTMYEPTS